MTEISIDNPFPGAVSLYVSETSSTMDEARAMSARTAYGLVRAGTQSAGRGRLPGRSWESEPGDSLLVTFWFPRDEFGRMPLPLLAGLALVGACEAWAAASGLGFRSNIALKWPNDVLCGGRKLSGILCESSGSTIYAGIGVNCGQSAFGSGFRTEPTSILIETGAIPEPDDLLGRLARSFLALRGAEDDWRRLYQERLAWRGRRVAFRPGIDSPEVEGTLEGVDEDGFAVISGKAFPSGELFARY